MERRLGAVGYRGAWRGLPRWLQRLVSVNHRGPYDREAGPGRLVYATAPFGRYPPMVTGREGARTTPEGSAEARRCGRRERSAPARIGNKRSSTLSFLARFASTASTGKGVAVGVGVLEGPSLRGVPAGPCRPAR